MLRFVFGIFFIRRFFVQRGGNNDISNVIDQRTENFDFSYKKKKKKNAKRKWEFHTIRTIEAFFISFRLIAKI